MKYCLIENNEVVDGPRNLPKNWRNISGFYLATDEMIKEKGWLPFTEETPTIGKYEVKELIYKFTINADNVVGVFQKRDMTDDEKASHDEFLATQYQRDRKEEYPTIAELVVALYDIDDKANIDKRRADVKAKYPKP
jgi:hypothetical protein